jgi:acyl-CoA synthetase (AMP-forming)/AMP-acid ligase II
MVFFFDFSNSSFLFTRVPSMVADLIDSSLAGHPLEGLLFGGSPTPDSLVGRARKAFPKATMYVVPTHNFLILIFDFPRTQAYGLTETNSIAVSVSFLGCVTST